MLIDLDMFNGTDGAYNDFNQYELKLFKKVT